MNPIPKFKIVLVGLIAFTGLFASASGEEKPTPTELRRSEILWRARFMMEGYEHWSDSPGPKNPASVALIDGITEQYLVDAMKELIRIPDRELLRQMMMFVGTVVPLETRKQYGKWGFLMLELQNLDKTLNPEIDAALRAAGRPTLDERLETQSELGREARQRADAL